MSATARVPDDPRRPAHRVDASRVWALLIGINVYYSSSDCSPLRGCVNDVQTMVEFLVHDLGMSEGHIKCLLSSSSDIQNPFTGTEERRVDVDSPIHKHIIDTLLSLSTKPEIQYGDNIIIYFAGHGSSYKCSDYYLEGGTSGEGYIDALCPMDRTSSSSTDYSILDISDREINTILTELSLEKGPHITFILDCCYSAGNTRGPTNVQHGAVPLPPSQTKNMLEEAHTRLRDLPKYHSVFDVGWKPDVSSHVALAACKDYQTADEGPGTDDRWSGMFMQVLIEALKSDNLNEESTYADLICALKMPRKTTQTPVVSGNARARLWYQGEVQQSARNNYRGLLWVYGCIALFMLFSLLGGLP
ncbi:hypothetical protein ARMGADRAFT_1092975 [Armillaria gallica]|uniref:Peptidase C14 caspase domain-containing protein n=1 Tax=Armillaria gallica TaxID=47427 RepID=A0A2H3CE56_ARMGA|nr:hypothetical protein ARMGADRAFT_1092975 [Armillaria gallica]